MYGYERLIKIKFSGLHFDKITPTVYSCCHRCLIDTITLDLRRGFNTSVVVCWCRLLFLLAFAAAVSAIPLSLSFSLLFNVFIFSFTISLT